MKQFDQFMRSTIGKIAIGVILLLVVIAIVVGGKLGTGGLSGTAGLPPNGYTCLPTCVEKDAKMFVITGKNQQSLINIPIKVWIMVPGDQPALTLGIFDGDTGKNSKNALEYYGTAGYWNGKNGNWDDAQFGNTTYTLYADPLADGSGQSALASWVGNDVMLNNAWWETNINNDANAQGANGHYYYRLEATRPTGSIGGDAFKVRANGYLMTGLRQEWPVEFTAMAITTSDYNILKSNPYKGDFNVYFKVSAETSKIEIWDADFDYANDTDDPNTTGKPTWAIAPALDEGVGKSVFGKSDDINNATYNVSPAVTYELINPDGQSVCLNSDPSGTKEWEDFIVSTDPADNPECLVSAPLTAGMYTIHVTGLDLHNFVWLSVNYPICDILENGGCPPMPNE